MQSQKVFLKYFFNGAVSRTTLHRTFDKRDSRCSEEGFYQSEEPSAPLHKIDSGLGTYKRHKCFTRNPNAFHFAPSCFKSHIEATLTLMKYLKNAVFVWKHSWSQRCTTLPVLRTRIYGDAWTASPWSHSRDADRERKSIEQKAFMECVSRDFSEARTTAKDARRRKIQSVTGKTGTLTSQKENNSS